MPLPPRLLLLALALSAFGRTAAQGLSPAPGLLYDDASVGRVDLALDPDSLQAIYDDPSSDVYTPVTFTFTRGGYVETLEDVGLRLRGNFSRFAAKKNFKISFNRFAPGRKFHGVEKLNLNGQANDPTVARAKITSDLTATIGPEATRAGHVEVWINGDYYGLYINVEHIDEQFAENHFGSSVANVYKCLWPAALTWEGSSASNYGYCEHTEAGDLPAYADVVAFIDALNNTPDAELACALESHLNVDGWLRQAAIEVITGHWDGYIWNHNNFYLVYNPIAGRLEYVIYDTDNTWGIDWVGGDWGTRDVYDWEQGDRPLYERLLDIPELRARFSWYLDRLLTDHVNNAVLDPSFDALEALISPSAEADPYRPLDQGYSIDDFHDAWEMPLWGHVDYGLKDYVGTRHATAGAQLEAYDVAPVVNHWRHNYPVTGQAPVVTAFGEDDDPGLGLWCVWTLDGVTDSLPMADDGAHHDGAAGDGVFGAVLPVVPAAADWSYRIHAYGGDGRATRRPCEPEAWRIDAPSPGLVVNEMLAANASGMTDPQGETADWLEVFNAGDAPVFLGHYFLSDDPRHPAQWRMPEVSLPPGGFAWFWMDDDEEDGPNHANFRLDADGGHIGIYAPDAERHRPVWTLDYGPQTPDVTTGFLPDGGGAWGPLGLATPGWSNVATALGPPSAEGHGLRVYPNPASDRVWLEGPAGTTWRLFSADGREWGAWTLDAPGWVSLTGIPARGPLLLRARHAGGAGTVRLLRF